ncbi:MAG: hypothetical protein KIS77_11610 [Saprospiraceae bacterium]|nr:hypothetical protein [Saprospiraceae bacterium]
MAFLFWLFWIADLLICLLALVGKGFRDSFSASSINTWYSVLLFGCTIGGLLLRFAFKKALLSLLVVALPLLILLVWYLLDSKLSA